MKKLLILAVMAIGTLLHGCIRESSGGGGDHGIGALRVTISGGNGNYVDGSRAVGNPAQSIENTVKSFTVYVFSNSNGLLEKSQTFGGGVLTGTLTGISTAFTKRVVVLVNSPAGYPSIEKYGDFAAATSMIELDSQVPGDFSTTGLFMSGEKAPVTVTDGMNLNVEVSRIVSKVKLGSLAVTPDLGMSLDKFTLTGVTVQRARDHSPVLGGLAASGFDYVGGLAGNASSVGDTPKAYLHEAYTLPNEYMAGTSLMPGVYFYVFPNDNTGGKATLLNIYGQYDGVPMYYPFYINETESSEGGNNTDGEFIGRNKVYVLHVTLRKIAAGADNPDNPNEQTNMDVTVDVQDWENTLVQHVEW